MLIVVNTAVVIAAARRQVSFESLVVTFLVRIAVNVVLVLVARIVLGPTTSTSATPCSSCCCSAC